MKTNWWRRLTGRDNTEESGTLSEINGAAMAIVEAGHAFSEESYSKAVNRSSDQEAHQEDAASRPWIVTRIAETETVSLISPEFLMDTTQTKESEPFLQPDMREQINAQQEFKEEPVADELIEETESEIAVQEKQQDGLQDALQKGMAVKMRDLQARANGWVYRDIPVMVYGVDVKNCADPSAREEFYHRVHLIDCCSELQNPEQHAMVGIDYESIQGSTDNIEFELCHDCLCHVNYLDYRHRARTEREEFLQFFSFSHYVMMQGSEFFTDKKFRIWPEHSHIQTIKPEGHGETGTCCSCGWQCSEHEAVLLSEKQCDELGLPQDTCVLCAQEQLETPFIIPGGLAERLYRDRFQKLQPEVSDWQTLRLHLDKSWHNLTYCLQREKAPLPELYLSVSEIDVVPTMAWPQLKRAIVVEVNDQMNDAEWDFWSRKDVLASF